MRTLTTYVLVGLIGAAGCERKQPQGAAPSVPAGGSSATPPADRGTAASALAAPAGAGARLSVAAVSFKVPDGWEQRAPANAMRLAELHVPDPSGDAAKGCVVVFSSAGGDPATNITRWGGQVLDATGQPSAPTVESKTIAGLKVHLVRIEGSYVGMGEAPKAGWMLSGAIVEMPGQSLFIKMTGPREGMEAAAPAFGAMVEGMSRP